MTRLTIICQYAPTPGFYVDYQYNRATEFLSWMTTQIHTNSNFRNVGMLGIVNEPVQNTGTVASMISTYYPNAYNVGLPSLPSLLAANLIPGDSLRRISSRYHLKQLPPRRNDELALGIGKPKSGPQQYLLRRLRRPPLP
jgi:hypothetical protein